ncbi:MAG: hypothetical protein Q4C89_07050 [Deinococcus sp.]|uniref:hypothetical protein n=1 Tax=Deinococcus sp. TaxID=47478 RepID=UPI0026DAA10F|nr:hypothetical protein [Deinococcus sp.]MDO4245762.1 hypothetical protein [Deinococcus sp.]
MTFTPRQLELLRQSCYGDPQLPEYLERILVEGPGDYDWPPEPGYYEGEQIPLHERIWAQIWHQGDIYPATYVAVPVLCEVVARFPQLNHWLMLSNLVAIEQSRPRFEPHLKPYLDTETLAAYDAALADLLPHLPAQLRMQDDSTQQGLSIVQRILALMAFATGQQWAGTLWSTPPLIDFYTGSLAPVVEDAAANLNRNDLPNNLKAEWQAWWANRNTRQNEPPESLDF